MVQQIRMSTYLRTGIDRSYWCRYRRRRGNHTRRDIRLRLSGDHIDQPYQRYAAHKYDERYKQLDTEAFH